MYVFLRNLKKETQTKTTQNCTTVLKRPFIWKTDYNLILKYYIFVYKS